MSVTADIYIANFKNNKYPTAFFNNCGYEIAGNFRPKVDNVKSIETFEDFVDGILTSRAWVQLIVTHGDTATDKGMLIKLTKESPYLKIGDAMENLAWLAEHAKDVETGNLGGSGHLNEFMSRYGFKNNPEPGRRIIRKLGQLHALKKHNFIVEVRGCSVGKDPNNMQLFRRALGARIFSGPNCRQLYLPIKPEDPANLIKYKGHLPFNQKTIDAVVKSAPSKGKTRRRVFGTTGGYPGALVVDVHDIDGHSNVEGFSFLGNPSQTSAWATKLLTSWKQSPTGAASNEFVLPVMWDDNESSFHVPLEDSYFYKIKMVTY